MGTIILFCERHGVGLMQNKEKQQKSNKEKGAEKRLEQF
jgi:hypothetical protein